MYQQIKHLADEAMALQNKDAMDEALREISALCANKVSGAVTLSEESLTALIEELQASGEKVTYQPTTAHFKIETPFDGVSTKALWPATKEFFDAKYQNEPVTAYERDVAASDLADDAATPFPFPRESNADATKASEGGDQ